MEKKKLLIVNCATCDARYVQESTLEAYEKVVVNCANALASQESRALLDQYSVMLNTAKVVDVEGDVKMSSVNGTAEIAPGKATPEGKTYLTVNGRLEVAPGSEEILKNYVGFTINGTVTCPESLAGYFANAQVNGRIETYPDGAIRLKSTAVLDRTFPLRSRQDALYYASRRVVALDPDIDFRKLAERNVRFSTRRLLVAESLTEAAVPLFDEQADILVLPDGCAFVSDDAVLDDALLRRHGGKLYINGDLTITQESVPCLERVEYLRISGDLLVLRSLKEAAQGLKAEYGELRLISGTQLCDRASLTVDRSLLEHAEDGVDICDCAMVKFKKDVPAELIREKVMSLRDCAMVSCTEEQEGAVEAIAEDVAHIDTSGQGALKEAKDAAGGLLDKVAGLLGVDLSSMTAAEKIQLVMSCKVVNAADYVL